MKNDNYKAKQKTADLDFQSAVLYYSNSISALPPT